MVVVMTVPMPSQNIGGVPRWASSQKARRHHSLSLRGLATTDGTRKGTAGGDVATAQAAEAQAAKATVTDLVRVSQKKFEPPFSFLFYNAHLAVYEDIICR
jgi:hypothetical protein